MTGRPGIILCCGRLASFEIPPTSRGLATIVDVGAACLLNGNVIPPVAGLMDSRVYEGSAHEPQIEAISTLERRATFEAEIADAFSDSVPPNLYSLHQRRTFQFGHSLGVPQRKPLPDRLRFVSTPPLPPP